MISAREALERLKEGNRRFVSGSTDSRFRTGQEHRNTLVGGQEPFAVVLGCSDSRVPTEIIFDQGLGDLFVIRVAGNIVAPSLIGSVEFAAEQFGTELVVVLGHSGCGAVEATLSELSRPSSERSKNLRSIVERIRPSVEPLLEDEDDWTHETLMELAIRANIRNSAEQLTRGSTILQRLSEEKRLLVVGAEYSLQSGAVEMLDRDTL